MSAHFVEWILKNHKLGFDRAVYSIVDPLVYSWQDISISLANTDDLCNLE